METLRRQFVPLKKACFPAAESRSSPFRGTAPAALTADTVEHGDDVVTSVGYESKVVAYRAFHTRFKGIFRLTFGD